MKKQAFLCQNIKGVIIITRENGKKAKEFEFNRYTVEYLDSVDSTNTYAKARARGGARNGHVVIASAQSAGRGRMGRSFFSPDSSGIYMSVIFRGLADLPKNAGRITAFAAVCVCEAISELFGINARIKWVNDVLIEGKKVCGILTESSIDSSSLSFDHTVIGIGINVERTSFPPELEAIACSIKDHSDSKAGKRELIAEILKRLSPLLDGEVPADTMDKYRERSALIGKEVFTLGNPSIRGTAVAIDDSGSLIIRQTDGSNITLSAGEISVRKAD